MSEHEVKAGRWYLCAMCRQCHQPIPLLWIEKDAQIGGDGSFVWKQVPCPYCGLVSDYLQHEAQRLEAREEAPPEETRH